MLHYFLLKCSCVVFGDLKYFCCLAIDVQYHVQFIDEEWDYKLFYIYREEAKPLIAKIQSTVSVTIFTQYLLIIYILFTHYYALFTRYTLLYIIHYCTIFTHYLHIITHYLHIIHYYTLYIIAHYLHIITHYYSLFIHYYIRAEAKAVINKY